MGGGLPQGSLVHSVEPVLGRGEDVLSQGESICFFYILSALSLLES
jgi:hypothetical protein